MSIQEIIINPKQVKPKYRGIYSFTVGVSEVETFIHLSAEGSRDPITSQYSQPDISLPEGTRHLITVHGVSEAEAKRWEENAIGQKGIKEYITPLEKRLKIQIN